MLAAALAAAGADIELLPTVADDESAHREALARGLAADVLVTSGGVSVGPHDLVRQIEAELGVEEVFWRVAIKPGKPISFGVRGATLVFGLPGNPVSSLVGCELFVKPALRALQGLDDPLPRVEHGVLAAALRRNDARDEFVRARSRLDRDGVVLEPLSGQESHMIARAAAADALVHVPRGDGELSTRARPSAGSGSARAVAPSARSQPCNARACRFGCASAPAAARARCCGRSGGADRAAGAPRRTGTARSGRRRARRAVPPPRPSRAR